MTAREKIEKMKLVVEQLEENLSATRHMEEPDGTRKASNFRREALNEIISILRS